MSCAVQEAVTKRKITAFILLLTTLGQMAIDIYLPSLPSMVDALNTSNTILQLSLTTFLLGFALSQLFYGPLSDRHGRKPILTVGLSIFFIGSIICMLSTTITLFCIARLIQGLGIGAASMMSRAISRDIFDGKELAKISSYIAMSWACVPIMAPLFGSYIEYYLGWRFNFAFLGLTAVSTLLAVITLLPETNCRKSVKIVFISNYAQLLKSRIFIKFTLCAMLLYGAFVYINMAGPFILQILYHQSVIAYGWWMVFIASGYLFGSFLSGKLLNHMSSEQIINYGLSGYLCFGSMLLLFAITGGTSILSLALPLLMIFFSVGLMYPQCIAGCLSPFGHIAGSAGALFGCMTFIGGTLASFLISFAPENSTLPFTVLMLTHAILVAALYWSLRDKKN